MVNSVGGWHCARQPGKETRPHIFKRKKERKETIKKKTIIKMISFFWPLLSPYIKM